MPVLREYILLSFCIPTFNQPQLIKNTLQSIVDEELSNIEILIRDDSDDNLTQNVINDYANILPIRYFHMKKEGVDRAFMFLSKEAMGEFVWWFGDDIINKGTFTRVKNILQSNKNIDFMYINSVDTSFSLYSINGLESQLITDKQFIISRLKDQLGFCSALLFNRQILVQGLKSSEDHAGSSWVTLYLSLYAIVYGDIFYFLSGPNFICEHKRVGEQRWYNSFQVHSINYCKILRTFNKNVDHKLIEELVSDKFFQTWKSAILERSLGYKTNFATRDVNYIELIKCYYMFPQLYLALMLLLIPPALLKYPVCAYRFLKIRFVA